jgi:hypothetical protein
MARPAPPRPIGPHLMNCRLLRDLDVERNSFCSLTVAETDGGKLATGAAMGRSVHGGARVLLFVGQRV